MKVLSVSTHFNIGGISNYILTLAGELGKTGVETIIATSGGDLQPELRKRGIEHRLVAVDTKFEFNPKLFIAAMQLKNIIEKEKIDIIHAHSRVSQVAAMLASGMTGIPFVTTCHGYFKKRLRKVFDTWGSKVIAISDAVKDHLIRDLEVPECRVRLIYSGVDADRFSRLYSEEEIWHIKKELGLKNGPVVGTIGRLSPVKGQKYLIEALDLIIAKTPDAQGLIIGDGPEKEALESQAKSLGISESIKFISSNVDTPRLLSIMDVFVFPSLKEGLGIALLEALAAGLACVASGTGGISDIITNGSDGILVNVADPEAIAAAAVRLLDDPLGRKLMGEAGKKLVRSRFTLARMAVDVEKLYREAMIDYLKK